MDVVDVPPVYRDVALPTAPQTEITAKGDIVYTEISRQHIRKLESYVKGEWKTLGVYLRQCNADLTNRNGFRRCSRACSQPGQSAIGHR